MLYGLFVSAPPHHPLAPRAAVGPAGLSTPWAALIAGGVALHLGLPDLTSATGSAVAWAYAQIGLGALFVLAGVGGLTAAFAQHHRQQENLQAAAALPGGHERIARVIDRRGPGAALLSSAGRRGLPLSLALLRRAEQLDLSA